MSKYRDYFSIDENYFPQVNEEVLNSGAVDWRKFYPHVTFIKLLKDVESVLSRRQRQSIWVEGAYGTGKSHAVLTLKKLLCASEEDTKEYFEKYNLDNDLYNKIQGAKKHGTILTIHRYGASAINNDRDLIMAMQESIKNSLIDNKIKNKGEKSLKDSIVLWLSDETNKSYFDALIKRDHSALFDGDDIETILSKLQTHNDQDLAILVNSIFKVADAAGITALRLDITGLITWINSIISKNGLKAIIFIWDEFTEYFDHNKHALTGFQQLIELSATSPFYLVIVTHKSEGLFHDTDSDKKKILDRFIKPRCNIELPENMAFKLMGAAMEKKDDPVLLKEWKEYADDLNDRLNESRRLVMKSANISEEELKKILPIHPYTALLLKYLSSAFDSNQRSMFDFIKNDRGDDVKGFQWYIDNHGPLDNTSFLLTIDMLWDFFYEKGKDHLSDNIRTILDSFNRQSKIILDDDHQRVLKTILLLQAISLRVGDAVELFIPNDKNINNAFDGTELEGGAATSIADKLVREDIIYRKPMGANKFQYSAMVNAGDATEINKTKKEYLKNKRTQDLVSVESFSDVLNLTGALKLRYIIRIATVDNLKRVINELKSNETKYENNILAVVTYAKEEAESYSLKKMISEACSKDENEIIFIDTSLSTLGKDGFDQYCDNIANSSYFRGKDNSMATQYEKLAAELLEKWKDNIISGEFYMYAKVLGTNGTRYPNIEAVHKKLKEINRNLYPLGLDDFKVTGTMYASTSLASGALCGAKQKTSGTYRSGNIATKLETSLSGAWETADYWKTSKSLLISKVKNSVEEEIAEAFKTEGKISIVRLYNLLKSKPFGFIPCNLTAFILGFLLKEYTIDIYRWSDGQVSERMSLDKLKEMIDEIIKQQIFPNNRYREKYIVTMTEQEIAFSAATARVFGIPENQCSSIDQTRDRLRKKMKELAFPIWTLQEIVLTNSLKSSKEVVEELIDAYSGVGNSSNFSERKSEMDIALQIGELCINYPTAVDDLEAIVNKDNCQKGMEAYLSKFENGKLIELANEIDDKGAYIEALQNKLDADAANWAWNFETVCEKIKDLIVEYSIIAESNKINSKAHSFSEMTATWCEKLNIIRLSYDAIKNEVDDVKPMLELLVKIKKSGVINSDIKLDFLSQLENNMQAFKNLLQSQNEIFKHICNFWLEGLTGEQIDQVFKKINSSVFTKSKSEYFLLIEDLVKDYRLNLGKTKLRKLWYDKTGTTTPKLWSSTFQTPIMCLIENNEDDTKRAFDTINSNNPDEKDINKAIEYLKSTNVWQVLENSDQRDKCFMKKIVRNYSAVLNDIDEIRLHLMERVSSEVYDWYPSIEVQRKILEFAEARYNSGGSDKAIRKIEEMEPEILKSYLKDLVKDNIVVGMEIIINK